MHQMMAEVIFDTEKPSEPVVLLKPSELPEENKESSHLLGQGIVRD